MIRSARVTCPYCGERFKTVVDCSAGNQEYVEDCEVCCKPIVFTVTAEDGELIGVETRTEDE